MDPNPYGHTEIAWEQEEQEMDTVEAGHVSPQKLTYETTPQRMAKVEALALARILKRVLIAGSIVVFGAFSWLAAHYQAGSAATQSSTSSASSSTQQTPSDQGGFFHQQGGGYGFGSQPSQHPFSGSTVS